MVGTDLKALKILFFTAAIFPAAAANAQVFMCDGVYSSKPCPPKAEPVDQSGSRTGERTSGKLGTVSCKASPDGFDLRLSDTELRHARLLNGKVRTMLAGQVVNAGEHYFTGSIDIRVRETKRGQEETMSLSLELAPGAASPLVMDLARMLNEEDLSNESGRLSVILDYQPKKICTEFSVDYGMGLP